MLDRVFDAVGGLLDTIGGGLKECGQIYKDTLKETGGDTKAAEAAVDEHIKAIEENAKALEDQLESLTE